MRACSFCPHRLPKRVVQIPDEIVGIFQADGKPDAFGRDARFAELFVVELRVRRRCGMNDQALHIAHICKVAPQLERVDKAAPRIAPAANAERKDGTRAARKIVFCEFVLRMRGKAGVADPFHFRPLGQELRDYHGVAYVRFHATRTFRVPAEAATRPSAPSARRRRARFRARIRNAYSPNVSVKTLS